MERITVKGKVLIDPASGHVRVMSKGGRLAFPMHVIEADTAVRRQIRNCVEFMYLMRKIRKHRTHHTIPKSMVIQEKINSLLRGMHPSG